MARSIHRTSSADSRARPNGRTACKPSSQEPGQPQQLALLIEAPKQSPVAPRKQGQSYSAAEPTFSVDGLEPRDRVVNTREAVRIAGKHRATLFRWARDGKFPKKRTFAGGKRAWVLSDIERWMAGETKTEGRRPKSNRHVGENRADRHRHPT